MAHQKVETWQQADEILQMEIQRQNHKTLRTTGKVPIEVWEEQVLKPTAQLRPSPDPSLLDLHLSLRASRKVHLRHIIQLDGCEYESAPTSRKSVTVLFHPRQKLWELEHSPKLTWPPILGHFTLQFVRFCSGKKSGFAPSPIGRLAGISNSLIINSSNLSEMER